MADYKVNMKQWNGTSFDNVLPLAYNAKQLGGQSLAEVKQWVQDNGLLLYTGQYVGTGTHGASSPMVFTFPFEPIVLFMPIIIRKNYSSLFNPIICGGLTQSYQDVGPAFYYPNNLFLSMKMSSDRKTISWYVTGGVGSEMEQANLSGYTYSFAAIGGYDMGGN